MFLSVDRILYMNYIFIHIGNSTLPPLAKWTKNLVKTRRLSDIHPCLIGYTVLYSRCNGRPVGYFNWICVISNIGKKYSNTVESLILQNGISYFWWKDLNIQPYSPFSYSSLSLSPASQISLMAKVITIRFIVSPTKKTSNKQKLLYVESRWN